MIGRVSQTVEILNNLYKDIANEFVKSEHNFNWGIVSKKLSKVWKSANDNSKNKKVLRLRKSSLEIWWKNVINNKFKKLFESVNSETNKDTLALAVNEILTIEKADSKKFFSSFKSKELDPSNFEILRDKAAKSIANYLLIEKTTNMGISPALNKERKSKKSGFIAPNKKAEESRVFDRMNCI